MDGDNFRTVLVANPTSANGALGRRWKEITGTIRACFGPFDEHLTSKPGDATAITREILTRGTHEMVVAVGGDGTISEVADGFFKSAGPINPDVVLGVLPFGTGGDFRKSVGVPKKLEAGARALRGRAVRRIDVGRLSYHTADGELRLRHFVNVASFGIGGLVDELVNTTTKALGGRVSFALATLRAMRRYQPQQVQLRFDGGVPQTVTLHSVAVANGRYFGGGMHIAPEALLDDGLFDVVTLGPLTTWDLLLRGHRVYSGTHLTLPQASHCRARHIEATPFDPGDAVLLDVDGETPGRLPATFELLPLALPLKIPEQ